MSETQDSINQRIKTLIDQYAGGVQRRFAQETGLSTGMVSDLFGKRENKPGLEMLKKIANAYPQLRMRWLLLGEEPMTDVEHHLPKSMVKEEQAPYKGAEPRILAVQVGPDNEENIELVSVRAAAGYASGGFLNHEFIEKLPSFRLPDAAYMNGSFRAFQVSGESMQSTLYDGDWVICRYVERWDRDIRDMYVHVVVTEENVLVKRVNNRLNERGELALHSDNAAFPIQFIDGQQIREVWVAVGKLSRQFVNPRFDVNVELARQGEAIQELLDFKKKLESQGLIN
ncbi:LexA family transcriptional regulator [Hymenobacter sp. YC55]|uniref:S24 family peptidase n=1 Tax=Hymenobacter sp. YC55 TaxID=3034019 RepID=UPI0023F8B1C2|nr:LexA family transcriptional regulator [Hymenobacter sp. YC55]MDF7810740.1 S24 family peptidase [Hymenobacter sp. YC55]